MRLRDLLIVPAFAFVVMLLNVLVSFGVVWFWSKFVDPGHAQPFYEAFALKAAPISSVVAGPFLMFAAGLLIARKRDRRGALLAAGAVAGLYIVADIILLLAWTAGDDLWMWMLLSYPTKLLGALAGGLFANRRA